MKVREITEDEVQKLEGCLQALAEYHNEVSRNFTYGNPDGEGICLGNEEQCRIDFGAK